MSIHKGMRQFNTRARRRIRQNLIEKYGPYCQICIAQGKSKEVALIDMDTRCYARSFSIDHVIALADGGMNVRENMQPAHRRCNERKSSNAGLADKSKRKRVTNPGVRLAYTSSSY